MNSQEVQEEHKEYADPVLCAGISNDSTVAAGNPNTQGCKDYIQ